MLVRILLAIAALIAVLAVIGFLLPRKVHVERSVLVNAPPDAIFPFVNGYRRFGEWSPWNGKDPGLKVTMGGALFGAGAWYEWSGNKKVGTGRQEIVESQPDRLVRTRLQFGGFDTPSEALMLLAPEGAGTRLSWTLDVDTGANPVGHYFGLLMDRMVGPDYEAGLAKLKALAESEPPLSGAAWLVELAETTAQPYAYVSTQSSTDVAAIGQAIGAAYGKVGAYMARNGLKQAGAPITVSKRYDEAAKVYEFDAGIPVDRADAPADPGGQGAIARIFQHMFETVDQPCFIVLQAITQGDQAFLTWDFHFQRKPSGQPLRIHGATHLRFDAQGRITMHRDYWDAAEELYAKLPLLGHLMRWLQGQLRVPG
jgi:ketosteroid isomerase-like protein